MRLGFIKALFGSAMNSNDGVQQESRSCPSDTERNGQNVLETARECSAGKKLSREEVERRIAKEMKKLRLPTTGWVAGLSLPEMRYTDGEPVPTDIVRYLLARQAKCQDMLPAFELKPLYEIIDRTTSADFARALLQEFIASGAQAKDKWVLAVAALLGDDRLVPVFESNIKKWAESSRGKLAEWAVGALALLGTDRALLAVDSIAMRYRTKMKNIGAAAVEAFACAADTLGVTPEELGDRVIPWMGFEPGRPRVVDCGGRQIEARIGLDLKLKYYDLDKGKAISSLPPSAPTEVKDQFKELAALLREVAKSQSLRLENLMVRGRRWPVERWRELFTGHPMMVPFGVKLVWGAYVNSVLKQTFRALEDGSLTDFDDEEVTLPEGCEIGIVHPLELDEETRERWKTHLEDYEIAPPFAQMARPVVMVSDDDAKTVFYAGVVGAMMNGLTFKGRAERMGWRRGSVCDAGSITAYAKSFPSAGVDAFLLLDDMFVGIDMYSEIALGVAFFVTTGSVKIGSYEYDEPTSESDPRLVRFGQVPPIVFSEVMGDLSRIAAGQQEE